MFNWFSQSPATKQPTPAQPITEDSLPPHNLLSKILEVEYQCQGEAGSQDLITQLTTLYLEAIQHYRGIGSGKDRIYKKRMEIFLKKQNIDGILNGGKAKLVNYKEETIKKLEQARNKSRSEVSRLMNKSDKQACRTKEMLVQQLQSQQSKLDQRIHRRRVMSNKSTTSRASRDEQDIDPVSNSQRCLDIDLMLSMDGGKYGGKKVLI